MPFGNKNSGKARSGDPISDRARTLNEQIAALESEIKRLDHQLQHAVTPKLRSTTLPHGQTVARKPEPPPVSREPVFEEVKSIRTEDQPAPPEHFNEQGVRKYDLPGLMNRIRGQFSRPVASNPRLVTYLAAGGVRGLRPLRVEKRKARLRFVFLAGVFFFILVCLIEVLRRH